MFKDRLKRGAGLPGGVFFVTALLFLCASFLRGASIDLPVREYRLHNGLKLLVLPRHHVPQIACQITYLVGSAYEKPGITGISHFLEHLMFKGTERIGVKDLEKDRRLRAELDRTAGRISKLRAQLGEGALKACLLYEREKKGSAPEGWETYLALKKLGERMAQLRKEQDQNIISEELWKRYQQIGGTEMNAQTGYDYTRYYVKLPAGTEELFFFLESDRMENAVFRQFYPEKEVVLQERNQRVDGTPTGRFYERLQSIFFEAHPYRWPVIGYPEDVRAMRREDLRAHYRRYYRPNNAILTLVGDIEPDRALALAERYFGPIQPGPAVERPRIYSVPDLGIKRIEVSAAAQSRVIVLFHTPPEGHPDSYALDLAAGVLDGTVGRLHRRLVLKEKAAIRTAAWNWTRKFAGEFGVMAFAAPGADLSRIEELLLEEVQRLAERLPADEELRRSRLQAEAQFVHELERLMGSADLISRAEALTTWRDVERYLGRLEEVTAERVAAVVKRYLSGERTVGILKRKEKPSRAAPRPRTAPVGK